MNFLNVVSKTPIIQSRNEKHHKIVQDLKWKGITIPSRKRIGNDTKRVKSLSWCEKPKFEPITSEELSFSSDVFFDENYLEKNDFDLCFNEIEVSSEAYFKKPIIKENVDSELVIQKYKRFYYDFGSISFNLNDSQFTSLKINDSSELNSRLVVRFDVYDNSLIINTNKFVFQNKKFNVKNVEVKLKTSFETIPIELKHDNFSSPTKVYDIRKWGVLLKLKEMEYKFIVAFRLTENEISGLNIECEDPISFEDFSVCYKALYVYYNYQYLFNNNIIYPENPDFEKFRLSICFENLSDHQQLMLENIEFLNESVDYLGLNEHDEEKFSLLNKAQKYFLFYSLKLFFEKKPNLTELLLNQNLFNGLDFISENFDARKYELEELEMENELNENEFIESEPNDESIKQDFDESENVEDDEMPLSPEISEKKKVDSKDALDDDYVEDKDEDLNEFE